MTNQTTKDYLNYFVTSQNPNFAVMLKGKWGAGKTYFIRGIIEEWENVHVMFYSIIDTYGNEKHIVPPAQLSSNEERYVATLIPLCLHSTSQTEIDEANRFLVKKKIGTLREIKSMNFWKEDYSMVFSENVLSSNS